MGEENIKELNEIRKDLQISTNVFKKVLLMAVSYKYRNPEINEELLCEVVKTTLMNLDYNDEKNPDYYISQGIFEMKTEEEAFAKAINDLDYHKQR